jgi:bacterial/archaeal transporter family-2 protein
MKLSLWLILVFITGGLVSIQGGINSQLGKILEHPLQATLITFIAGTLGVSVIMLCLGIHWPKFSAFQKGPIYLFMGGFVGVIFISLSIIIIPKIGIANFLVGIICGELLMSLCLDHFGLFDVPHNPLTTERIVGVALVVIGAFIMNKAHLSV